MKQVRVLLSGGLGNQMFIAAAGISLASRLNSKIEFDLSNFTPQNPRKYALDLFEVPGLMDLRDHKLLKAVGLSEHFSKVNVFTEKSFKYDESFSEIKKPKILVGYFQSWRYFESHFDSIRNIYQHESANSLLSEITERVGGEFNAVHVRLGDYLDVNNQAYHGLQSENYYLKAMDYIEEKQAKKLPWVVFSDLTQSVPQSILSRANHVIEPLKSRHEFFDMSAMSKAEALVMSNSSFSWWAGFLGYSPNQIVIGPGTWFSGKEIVQGDLFLPQWISFDPTGNKLT